MPTFATPTPIAVTLDLSMGHTRLVAGDRADTVVDVRPGNPSRAGDVKAAEQTRVEYRDGHLLVKMAKVRGLFNRGGSIELEIALPAGSSVRGETALGGFQSVGRYDEVRLKSAAGDIELDTASTAHLRTSMGNLTVTHTTGHADVLTGSGTLTVERVDGDAEVHNSNGLIRVGRVAGTLRARTANGDIEVHSALADVTAKTACGSVRVDEVVRGTTVLETAAGRLEVGIRDGSAAWLDLHSTVGTVRNTLESATGPDAAADTVEVRARTGIGDIVVRRATTTTGRNAP
ncbi:DUF4097 family beta strand repeat-containing protein [Saccharothrix australiensis]|uniref:Putative adhesin n=1 Tax=Saccharothrix australiensis TaxID=2072 RepID=A0A495W4D5_9PSEU|nr:DUF4097 family beta strand repeat-containing protein [Saccharothrix australiensis]RKT56526.1 putative adhesin [Saccharothrix australiensis]